MKSLSLILAMVGIVLTLPVLIPVAVWQYARDQRRKRKAAETTRCGQCGEPLGTASLRCADLAWAHHVAAMRLAYPHSFLRLVRRIWAKCTVCGAEYDFDATAKAFVAYQSRDTEQD